MQSQAGAGDALIYDGNAGDGCEGIINPPRVGVWEAFSDGSGSNPEATPRPEGSLGGRAGADDCAMHTVGTALAVWGGGTGFSFHQFEGEWCPCDASAYRGIELWLKGTIRGTYTSDYAPQENTVRVQVKSGPDTGVDDHGFFCQLNAQQWARCSALFSELETEGWQANPPELDSSWLRGIGILAHL